MIIYDTEQRADAGFAGYDGPTAPNEGGFKVTFDGSHKIPSMILNGSDGEIVVTGWQAMARFADSVMECEKNARRMAGA